MSTHVCAPEPEKAQNFVLALSVFHLAPSPSPFQSQLQAKGQLNVAKQQQQQQQQQQNRLKQFILEKKSAGTQDWTEIKRICCCAKKLEQTKSATAAAEGNWTRSWLKQKTLGPSSVR